MENRIDKVVYTVGCDGIPEKWYLEKLMDDGTCFLRKSKTPRWIDTMRIARTSTVYPDRATAKNNAVTIFI